MGFPSQPIVSPSINDLVMGEPERLYPLGRRHMPRGTLAPRHLPRRMEAEPATVSRCISCNRCYSSEAHKCIFRK